ncbi:posphoenolpyruvate synthetase regulatory kinase/phosphorylase PpsR [Paraglaciecola hydrolytica]|uniref:Putative phosphoenolpyruvate synthase regulatory protein n=1 Tax=Paraglaciecola hydrolytica TaxID=1799789 RepID=A0A136A469_9ALTE|nr:pyruvate, water dikinase regulatory protein [Paraglaciecola hydrolytica]KXI29920.1 phosphoenolpyruvate synthase regulatory protein [Paraglaciecola hydrolytica]
MRTAYYISDGTAITAEVFGHALLSLFTMEFKHLTIPFVETPEEAQQVVNKISESFQDDGQRPLVFYTIVNVEVRKIISKSVGINYNFLDQFVAPLEKVLGIPSKPEKHRTHSIHEKTYDIRIEAVNYALANDDGTNLKDYSEADIILVGVSRSGKTPTSLYLALQYGIKAANYPFTEDDMGDVLKMPPALRRFKDKLFGLTIEADRLHHIRSERRANSRYASLAQCRMELREVENLYRKEKIPFLNSTRYSIEEISAKILAQTGLQRRKY